MSLRTLMNRLITPLDNGKFRVESGNVGPACESENARLDQIGPFRRVNIAASLTASALTRAAVDADAPTSVVMGRAGRVRGIAYNLNAPITAGTLTAKVMINGTETGAALNLAAAQRGVLDLPVTVGFNEGDRVGLSLTSNGALAPTTAELDADLILRWDATGDTIAE